MAHAAEQLGKVNLQPCEAKPGRKMSTTQREMGNRDTFPPAGNSNSHQELHEALSPADSLQLEQPTALGCSSQKDVPQPSADYKKEREKTEMVLKPQSDSKDHISVVAAEV